VLAALASMVAAVAAGAALALAGAGPRTLAPLRAFALAAVIATVAVHLLPEAIADGGGAVLIGFAIALAVPGVVARIANLAAGRGRAARGHRLAAELAYASLLLHKITDGIAVGAAVAPGQPHHWDVVVAVAGHTLPMAAVVAVAYRAHPRQAWLRALGLAVAIGVGALVADAAARTAFAQLAPWLTAIAAGLLLHVVTHDLPSGLARGAVDRVAELAGLIAGAALPVAVGWFDDDASPTALPARILEVARAVAPALVVGLIATAILQTAIRDRLVARARHRLGGAIRGALYGAAAPGCACAALATAASVRRRGGIVAAAIATALAAPALGVDLALVTAVLFGGAFAAARILGTLIAAIAAGAIGGRAAAGQVAAAEPDADVLLHGSPVHRFTTALDELITHAAPWTVAALFGAALVASVPSHGPMPAFLAVILAGLLAVTGRVAATATAPVAAALIAAGLPPGYALAAMVAGPVLAPAPLAWLRVEVGAARTAAIVAVVVAAAVATALATPALAPIALPRAVSDPCLLVIGLLALRSLWRFGVPAWVAALHGHGQHGHTHDERHLGGEVAAPPPHADHHGHHHDHGHRAPAPAAHDHHGHDH
jgi:hypothetical protein